MLKVRNIQLRYGGAHMLRDVCMDVPAGKITVVLGHKGSGKTSLLRAIVGSVPILSGSIEFDGQSIERWSTYERARSGIGFVAQGREVYARFTVEENLRMGLAYQSVFMPAELFELFPALPELMQLRCGELTASQQQLLAIARALLPKPKLLMLDEPSKELDEAGVKRIAQIIRQVVSHGRTTVVLCEQNYALAEGLADRYLVLQAGAVIAQGQGKNMAADGVRELVAE